MTIHTYIFGIDIYIVFERGRLSDAAYKTENEDREVEQKITKTENFQVISIIIIRTVGLVYCMYTRVGR